MAERVGESNSRSDAEIMSLILSIENRRRNFGAWLYYVRLSFHGGNYFKVGITTKSYVGDRFRSLSGLLDRKTLGLWWFSESNKKKARWAEQEILRAFQHHRLKQHEQRGLPQGRSEFFRENVWDSHGWWEGNKIEGFTLFKLLADSCEGVQKIPPSSG